MIIKRKLFNLLEMAINPAGHHIKKAQEKKQEESKLFARRDYEGLTEAEKYTLSQERSKIAKDLSKKRSKISKSYQGHINEIEKIAEDDVRKNILNPDNKGIPDWIEKNKNIRLGKAKKVRDSRYDKVISETKSKAVELKDKVKSRKIKLSIPPDKSIEKYVEKTSKINPKLVKKAAIGTAAGIATLGLTTAGVKAYKKKKESDKMEQARKSVFDKK